MASLLNVSLFAFLLCVVVITEAKPLLETSNNLQENKSSMTSQQLYELYQIMRTDPRLAAVSNQDIVAYIYKNYVLNNGNDLNGEKGKFSNKRYQQQQQMSFTAIPSDQRQFHRETGSTIFSSSSTRSLQFTNGSNVPQPSYNFQNTPSFDFTHRPTSASRKTDKRPGDVNDGHGPNRTPSEFPSSSSCQISNGSSSSASSSVSPRHKSKRACPETKEIDCTTDEGFWIQKQYYHALDDSSKELFDSLMEKLENIRIVAEENAARKQQRFVGRNRANKTRPFPTPLVSTTHLNEEANQQFNDKETLIKIHQEENEKKIEAALSSDEQQENKPESTGGLALA